MNKPTTVTVQDPAHLIRLISDAALDISTLQLCTDDILETVYTSVHENAVKGSKTNIFVGAFTTCHARLKLYESLDVLQKQVLFTMIPTVWCKNSVLVNLPSPSGIFWGI